MMIYSPNTTHWPLGALVIHDCDAKRKEMLMRVSRYNRDGLAVCEYVDKNVSSEKYQNDIKYLHDPAKFGIEVNAS